MQAPEKPLKKGTSHLTPERRSEISTKAGLTTLARYGLDYYAALGRKSAAQRRMPSVKLKSPHHVLIGKLSANVFTAEELTERSRKAGNTVLQRYGVEFYSAMAKKGHERDRERMKPPKTEAQAQAEVQARQKIKQLTAEASHPKQGVPKDRKTK